MKLIECPRDAMQGLHRFIPTADKVAYLNLLLQIGFDTIDFGSFVSPKAIPQLKDTREVLEKLDLATSKSKLLAIVANLRGVNEALEHEAIDYLGYPFSISETFQQRNTHSGIDDSLSLIDEMLEQCDKKSKTAVIYLSMGFGNPYGDPWNAEIVAWRTSQLVERGIKIISIADTTGLSDTEKIKHILPGLLATFSDIEIGVHLHSTPETRREKIEAAYNAGCRRFDSALKGYGGCPMATDTLTGNIATEDLVYFLESKGEKLTLDMEKWEEALAYASHIFF